MVSSEYTVCPMCGGEDGQGCYKDCPSEELPRLRAENERLRAALIVWRNAYKTGRSDPLVQAYEHSEALADQPAPSESHLAPDHQAAMHGALRRSVSVVQPAPGKEEA